MSEIDNIRARADAATAGPWHWTGNVKSHNIFLAGRVPDVGMVSVMDFRRSGMQGAAPRFIEEAFWMKDAAELAVFEVCRDATSPHDPRLYRHDIVGFRHADATFIAAARADVATLLAEVDRLSARLTTVTAAVIGPHPEHSGLDSYALAHISAALGEGL